MNCLYQAQAGDVLSGDEWPKRRSRILGWVSALCIAVLGFLDTCFWQFWLGQRNKLFLTHILAHTYANNLLFSALFGFTMLYSVIRDVAQVIEKSFTQVSRGKGTVGWAAGCGVRGAAQSAQSIAVPKSISQSTQNLF